MPRDKKLSHQRVLEAAKKNFWKKDLKMRDVKSYLFVKEYFSNTDLLVASIVL